MALLPTKAKPFKQSSQAKLAHPSRNLGQYLHPAGRGKDRHVTSDVPDVKGDDYNPQHNPDFKPKSIPKKNIRTTEKQVAGPNMGSSDDNSEAIGSLMGPASLTTPPAAFKTKKVKAKQMPFYGKV